VQDCVLEPLPLTTVGVLNNEVDAFGYEVNAPVIPPVAVGVAAVQSEV
jgi:hypothetical protein